MSLTSYMTSYMSLSSLMSSRVTVFPLAGPTRADGPTVLPLCGPTRGGGVVVERGAALVVGTWFIWSVRTSTINSSDRPDGRKRAAFCVDERC